MKITVTRINNAFNLEARNEDGNRLLMDSAPEAGGSGLGMRPMQLLLSSLGGCSAMDVITILKKQKQEIDFFEIEVNGNREKTGDVSLFRNIELHFKLKGAVERDKLEKAIVLSLEKYCSVAKTLEPTARISYKITLNE